MKIQALDKQKGHRVKVKPGNLKEGSRACEGQSDLLMNFNEAVTSVRVVETLCLQRALVKCRV